MKEMGIKIVRYADAILIFAEDEREARKFRRIATDYLEGNLKFPKGHPRIHAVTPSLRLKLGMISCELKLAS